MRERERGRESRERKTTNLILSLGAKRPDSLQFHFKVGLKHFFLTGCPDVAPKMQLPVKKMNRGEPNFNEIKLEIKPQMNV